jgi:predicted RNA-binding protein
MCQARVFVVRDGKQELVAQDVIHLAESDEGVSLSTFFDEPVLVRGHVVSIDFLKHTVTLQPTEEATGGQ